MTKPKQLDWEPKPNFLSQSEADALYGRLLGIQWHGQGDNFEAHFGCSYQRGGGPQPNEVPEIPDFMTSLGRRISDVTDWPCNYVQCHKYGPTNPVNAHHDPGGMCVPMLVVGQERTFRVGGEIRDEYLKQSDRDLSKHYFEKAIVLHHGSLLIFHGKVAHSMKPAAEDPQANLGNWDWRFSLLFRWTTPSMRKYGPGKDDKSEYTKAREEWRASKQPSLF